MSKLFTLPFGDLAALRGRARHHRWVPEGATPAQIAEYAASVRAFWFVFGETSTDAALPNRSATQPLTGMNTARASAAKR